MATVAAATNRFGRRAPAPPDAHEALDFVRGRLFGSSENITGFGLPGAFSTRACRGAEGESGAG